MGIRERPSLRGGFSSRTPDEIVAFLTPFLRGVGSGSGAGLRAAGIFLAAGFFFATLRGACVGVLAARVTDFAGFAGFAAFLTTFFFAINLSPLLSMNTNSHQIHPSPDCCLPHGAEERSDSSSIEQALIQQRPSWFYHFGHNFRELKSA